MYCFAKRSELGPCSVEHTITPTKQLQVSQQGFIILRRQGYKFIPNTHSLSYSSNMRLRLLFFFSP